MASSQQSLSDYVEQTLKPELDNEQNPSLNQLSEEEFRNAQKRLGVGPYDEEDALDDEEWEDLFQRNEEEVERIVEVSKQR